MVQGNKEKKTFGQDVKTIPGATSEGTLLWKKCLSPGRITAQRGCRLEQTHWRGKVYIH